LTKILGEEKGGVRSANRLLIAALRIYATGIAQNLSIISPRFAPNQTRAFMLSDAPKQIPFVVDSVDDLSRGLGPKNFSNQKGDI
jgi:hypothetical protein